MKRTILLSTGILLLFAGNLTKAATVTWDPRFTINVSCGGSGTWDSTTANWSNGTSDAVWNSGDTAVFSSGSAGTSNVGVSGTVTVGGLTFIKPYNLNGGSTDLIALNSVAAITNNSGGTVTINTALAAASGFTTSGSFGTTFSGANSSVSGTVTIAGAAITLTNSQSLGSAVIYINTASASGGANYADALDINGTNLNIANNIVTGSAGTGSMASNIGNLSGTNTLSGNITFNRYGYKIYAATGSKLILSGTFINNTANYGTFYVNDISHAGTVVFAANGGGVGSTACGTMLIQSGTVIANSVTNPFGLGGIMIGSATNATLSVNSINAVVAGNASMMLYGKGVGGIVFGNNTQNYASTGILIYTGSGETTNSALSLASGGGASAITGTFGAVFDQSGTGLLKFTSNVLNTGTATSTAAHLITFQGSTSGTGEFAGVISDAVNGTVKTTTVNKNGTGIWVLSGNNTYSGDTTVGNGALLFSSLGSGTAAQALGSGTIVNIGVAATSSGTLQYTGAGGTLDKTIFALGNGLNTVKNSGSGLLTLSGSLVKNGTILVLNGGTAGINVTGQISGANANSDLYITSGTTKLSATNTYNGPTWVYGGGTLVNGVTNALPTNTSLILGGSDNSNGTFDLYGNNQTVAALNSLGSGTQTVSNNGSGISTLTVTSGGTYGGVIADGSGISALSLSGGNLVLGGSNTYSGATTVTGGTLTVNGSLAVGSAVSVNGATLAGTGTIKGTTTVTNATLNGNGLSMGATTFYGASKVSGNVGASSMTVASGTTSVTGSATTSGTLAISVGATVNNTNSITANTVNLANGATLINNGTVTGAVNAAGLLTGTGTIQGSLSIKSTGELAPGNDSRGVTTVTGALVVESGAKVSLQLDGLAGAGVTGGCDQIIVTNSGSVTLNAGSILNLTLNVTFANNTSVILIDNESSSAIVGKFTAVAIGGTTYDVSISDSFIYNGQQFALSYTGMASADGIANDVTLTVVPEPSTWAIVVGGMGMLVFCKRMRRA